MSLELRLQSGSAVQQVGEQDVELQGFVCFDWTSPFQRYIDFCRVTKIQVVLEGYVLTCPSKKATSGKKIYSSNVFCMKGIYGERKLVDMFPKRSFVYPFLLTTGQRQHMLPSCQSEQMLNVAYRLKTTLVLYDPYGQQRSQETATCSFTHQLPFRIGCAKTANESTADLIKRSKFPAVRVHRTANDHFVMKAALSSTVAHESDQLDTKIRIDNLSHQSNGHSKTVSRICGKIVQVCEVQEGETVEKKVEAFNIRLDKRQQQQRVGKSCNAVETTFCEELTIPFCLPDKMLPTLIQKDQRAKLSYHVKVEFYSGKKHRESTINLPLIIGQ